MLNDILFVQQSLNDHLFFLRTIKEFCLNIQLSFFQNEQDYIKTAEEYYKRGEELLERAFNMANGKVFASALDNKIFVTEYTLPLELLTEKLFDIKLDTSLTIEELNLKSGNSFEITDELLEELKGINNDALIFCENFIDFTNHIYNSLLANDIFSYSYPDLILYMKKEAELYQRDLIRLINRSGVDPITISDFGYYFSESLLGATRFIRGFANPSQTEIIQRASFFENEFNKFMADYQTGNIGPDNQMDVIRREEKIVSDYQSFLEEVIQGILEGELFFIVEPIFFDNLYTEANYFFYLLNSVITSQGNSN